MAEINKEPMDLEDFDDLIPASASQQTTVVKQTQSHTNMLAEDFKNQSNKQQDASNKIISSDLAPIAKVEYKVKKSTLLFGIFSIVLSILTLFLMIICLLK